jgi:hypothetical protein
MAPHYSDPAKAPPAPWLGIALGVPGAISPSFGFAIAVLIRLSNANALNEAA